MALTISQVNQGFLALFGRPATGAEATKFAGQADVASLVTALSANSLYKGELTASFPKIKMVDLNAATDDAFVESLYQAFIGRASDAEGKTFWLGVKAAGATREEVLAQFEAVLKEQAKEGTADGIAYENIMSENTSLVSAWVESLYQNLAARASDAEGLNYWTTQAIQTGSAASVVAAFAAALAAQGATTEDGQNFAQKQGVADAFTNGFKDFNSLITANEKAEVLKNIHTMMDGVNKDSQLDQYTEEIIKVANEYQNIASVQFTKSEEDQLGIDPETGESNLKSAANFTGTYNLTDPLKGTIQQSDSATGSEAFLSDTLTVNVTGYDKTTNDTFDLGELPSTTSVEKLYINNGAADVSGDINADFQYINVKGTGEFRITATTSNENGVFEDIVLNSGANKNNSFATVQNVTSIKTAAGNDTITVGTVTKSLNTGAGDDIVRANLAAKATADLGAGDDTFTGSLGLNASLAGGAGDDTLNVIGVTNFNKGKAVSTVEIDGGTGNDTLDLSTVLLNNATGIKSIKGVEALKVGTGTELYASAISGQKMTLAGTSLVLNATGATAVDLSKMANAEGSNVAVEITNVKSGNVNLEANDKNTNNIKEAIVLTNDAKGVTIKNFAGKDDTISIQGATANKTELFTYKDINHKEIGDFAVQVKANNFYYAETTAAISLNTFKSIDVNGLAKGEAIYVITRDGIANSSVAKVYKIVVGTTDSTKVASVTQMATINVANREVISDNSIVDGPTAPVVEPVIDALGASEVDLTNESKGNPVTIDATDPELKTLDIKGADADQNIAVDTVKGQNVTINVGENADGTAQKVPASIKTGDGNETIVIKGTQSTDDDDTSHITLIDGGAGTDVLELNRVDAAGSGHSVRLANIDKITNIETIKALFGATISAKALNGGTEKVAIETGNNDAKALTLWGDATLTQNLDISHLVKGGATATIILDGLDNTDTIKLSNTDGIVERIKLSADNVVTITGLATGDRLDLDAHSVGGLYDDAATTGVAFQGIPTVTAVLADNNGFFVDAAENIDTVDKALAKLKDLNVTDLAADEQALVAFNNGTDKAYIYTVTGVSTAKAGAAIDDTLKLVAIVDHQFTAADKNDYGIINLA